MERKGNEMNNYLQNIDETIQKYFKILSKEFPEFLFDYIETNTHTCKTTFFKNVEKNRIWCFNIISWSYP